MSSSETHWLEPLHDWPRAGLELLDTHDAFTRVVVARVRGSAPREVGTSMLVCEHRQLGTIGGGQLEHTAIEVARNMLTASAEPIRLERYTLATQLAQCCGGVVEIWYERYAPADQSFLRALERASRTGASSMEISYSSGAVDRRILPQQVGPEVVRTDQELCWREPLHDSRPNVWLFGAGHVGQALVRVFCELPIRVHWIDERAEVMPNSFANIVANPIADPVSSVPTAPSGTHFIVMTHSHALDYALCRAILQRRDIASLGLIGSRSKAARFRSRLAHDGVSADDIARLTCPIGVTGIHSKEPAVIAIAVAAQLLQRIDAGAPVFASRTVVAATCSAANTNGTCTGCDSKRAAS